MSSFLSRVASETSNALSDAYGHFVHGDDAGKSARIAYVARPVLVPLPPNATSLSSVSLPPSQSSSPPPPKKSGGGGGGGGESHHAGGAATTSSSSAQSVGGAAGGAVTAAAGDGGGAQSGASSSSPGGVRRTRRTRSCFDLGMTFLEVNGRAYVRTVRPNSDAARAGVQPRDAVQLACVLGGGSGIHGSNHRGNNDDDDGRGGGGGGRERGGRSGAELSSLRDDDDRAKSFALSCEKRGMRTNYDELRELFHGCLADPTGQTVELDHGDYGDANAETMFSNAGAGLTNGPGVGDGASPSPRRNRKATSSSSTAGTSSSAAAMTAASPSAAATSSSERDLLRSSLTAQTLPTRIFESPPSSPFPVRGGSGAGSPLKSGKSKKSPSLSDMKRTVRSTVRLAAGRCHGYVCDEGDDDETTFDGLLSGGVANLDLPKTARAVTYDDDDDRRRRRRHNRRRVADARGGGGRDDRRDDEYDGEEYDDDYPPPYPVVLVFRRTRQRRGLGGLASFGVVGVPSFRIDDECDRAASLIRRLAPTESTEPQPDAWDELVHDGTDWLLGGKSILPGSGREGGGGGSDSLLPDGGGGDERARGDRSGDDDGLISLDSHEARTSAKLARMRQRMHAEAAAKRTRKSGRDGGGDGAGSGGGGGGGGGRGGGSGDDVEAATIRGMIQKAVGLAFVRTSKVVVGLSVHGGSGIVIARLPDGTWSAPSAIGTWGLGFGIQFGLEVADYIFILQTEDSLEHFRRGGNFTIGGNIGAAVAGMGREAYGAASVGSLCGPTADVSRAQADAAAAAADESEYNDDETEAHSGSGRKKTAEIAPIVAYAKSQGLYFGVSLEGSKIYTRDDINARTYKFTTGRAVTTADILTGKVATPPEAEDLYASLHSVEFDHEISVLPRPPEILRKDSLNDWRFDRSTLTDSTAGGGSALPFSFLSNITDEQAEECSSFETMFKKFLYGGVSVQRLVPNAESSGGKTRKERRTLWLMLPEVGALRLGFISKLNDGDGDKLQRNARGGRAKFGQRRAYDADDYSEYSGSMVTADATEDGTFDGTVGDTTVESGKFDGKSGAARHINSANVHLSKKHSTALTDVTLLSQEPLVSVRFSPDDATEHLRVISIQDVTGTSLLFLANTFREAELLVCGLKLLLERETARLGVRGGVPINELGGKVRSGAMSPSAARGYHDDDDGGQIFNQSGHSRSLSRKDRRRRGLGGGYESSDNDDENDSVLGDEFVQLQDRHKVPEGRRSWSQVPSRHHLRGVAARSQSVDGEDADISRGLGSSAQENIPTYVHGQQLIRDVATNVILPLPLPLCRVLLLDSSSPVISKWEADRGDKNYEKSPWRFPPSTPRELEHHDSEHQLIASGSMMGAHRTTSYDRSRNGGIVHLSETQIVDADDSEKLAFTVTERMPRRGFSVKVRILLRSAAPSCCEATVLAELRPMGKNMSNQIAVHKAFHLVLKEVKSRYGTEGKGLLAGFSSVINNLPGPDSDLEGGKANQKLHEYYPQQRQSSMSKSHLGGTSQKENLTSFEDVLKTKGRPSSKKEGGSRSRKKDAVSKDSDKWTDRPPTPSLDVQAKNEVPNERKAKASLSTNDFADIPRSDSDPQTPVTIEVKPLPKIRLDLMPVPREEDEDNESANSPAVKAKKKQKSSRSKRKSDRKSKSRK